MTAPHSASSHVADGRAVARRPATALLALAVTAATALSTVAVVPAQAAPAPVALERVVVSLAGAGADGVQAAAEAVVKAGGTVLDRLPLVGGVSAELPAGMSLPGLQVVPDREMKLQEATDAPVDEPESPQGMRALLGLDANSPTGQDVRVAVVDTGVGQHPDLAGQVVESINVVEGDEGDGYGHGTFVAGLIAATGDFAGIAPGADIVDIDVADDNGETNLITVLRGLQAALEEDVDVVNLSLSSYSPLPYQIDPLVVALETLWHEGAVVVVPAGNEGPEPRTITSPGVSPTLLTVGALNADLSAVADFSSRGPAPQNIAKPDLVAPGERVVSLVAANSKLSTLESDAPATYIYGSGTSFSTAVVSGAAAVLLEQHEWTPNQVKAALMGSATPFGAVTAAGRGKLDVHAALAFEPPADATTGGPVPGSVGEWRSLMAAMQAENPKAVASSWSKLSPEAKQWAIDSWQALREDMRDELTHDWSLRNWALRNWALRNWAGDPADYALVDWALRNWALRNWALRNWALRNWALRNWADVGNEWLAEWDLRNWALRNWALRNWAGRNWAGRNWADEDWAGRNWAMRNWAGRNWAGRNWAGRNWADDSWAGRNWATTDGWANAEFTGRNWATSTWSARNWAVGDWG